MEGTLHGLVLGLVSLFIVNHASSDAVRDSCPESVPQHSLLKLYNGKCYEFIKLERYWDVAEHDCSSRGGNLVTIRDQGAQDFLMGALKSMNWDRNGLWIGAHDTATEGTWLWVTGEKVTWSNWGNGQPSCYVPRLKIFCAEDCAVLLYSAGGKWHDKRCHSILFTYSYVCEYDIRQSSMSTPDVYGTTSSEIPSAESSSYPEDHQTDTMPITNRPQSDDSVRYTTPATSVTTDDHFIVTTEKNCSEETSPLTTGWATNVVPENSTDLGLPVTSTMADEVGENATDSPDYLEVETKLPVLASTHIVIDKYGEDDYDYDTEYEYALLPETKAAQTKIDTEAKTKESVTGPVVGALVGLCLLAAVLITAYYIHRKRHKHVNEEWSVGFDNPNYGSQEASATSTVRHSSSRPEDEAPRVNVFPPEDRSQEMCGACSEPEACCSSAPEPSRKGNDYVSHDFSKAKV